jgi:hypothetical protein
MTQPKDADAEWLRDLIARNLDCTIGGEPVVLCAFDKIGKARFEAIAARLEQSAPVEVVEGLVEALRLSITDMGLCQCDVCSRSNAALAAYEQWKAEHRKDSQ